MKVNPRIFVLFFFIAALLVGTLPAAAQGGPGTEDFPVRDFGVCINLPDFTIVEEPDAFNTVYNVPGLFSINFAEYLLPLGYTPNSGNEIYNAMIALLNTVNARDYVRVNFVHPQYISAAVEFTLDGRRMFGMIYRNQQNRLFFLFADNVAGFDMLAIGRAIFAGDRYCNPIGGLVNPEYTNPPAWNNPAPAAPAPAANATVDFNVNGAASVTINAGQCATVAWNTANVNQVYYQGGGVVGSGSAVECPGATTTYTLTVVFNDGSTQNYTVTINVQGGGAPAPTGPTMNFSLPPTYGSINLTSGFQPDPRTVNITSGGGVDVMAQLGATRGGPCRGWATAAPDYSVYYTAGQYILRFYYESADGGDVAMVVNAPDTSWHCDDDAHGYPNPQIVFTNPMSGRYDIWITSYNQGQYHPGTLFITEGLN